jgi:Thiolase, C-terminal domain
VRRSPPRCWRCCANSRTRRGFAIPEERLNPNADIVRLEVRPGNRHRHRIRRGAVALGHPLGDSGTRGVLTLATELAERGARYGCLGICVGSGQGSASVLSNPDSKNDRRADAGG